MRNLLGSLVAVTAVLAIAFVGASAAYDRTPVRIGQLSPDQWGTAVTTGDTEVRNRYPSARSVFCVGVIMIGQSLSQSSFMHGTTRFWDKLFCRLTLNATSGLKMIYDSKGLKSGIVYRVKPWKPGEPAAGGSSSSGTGSSGSSSGGSGGGSVARIHPGILFRIASATVAPDRSATVTWKLPAETDSEVYDDFTWDLDGVQQHSFGTSESKRTQIRTRPLSPGTHVVAVTILYLFWTDRYYSNGNCSVSTRDNYVYICDFEDTSTVTLNIR